MIFNNIAIKIKNFNDFNKVQEISFKRGCKWYFSDSNKQYLYANKGVIDIGMTILIKNKILYTSNIQQCIKQNFDIIESNTYIFNKGFVEIKNFKILNI